MHFQTCGLLLLADHCSIALSLSPQIAAAFTIIFSLLSSSIDVLLRPVSLRNSLMAVFSHNGSHTGTVNGSLPAAVCFCAERCAGTSPPPTQWRCVKLYCKVTYLPYWMHSLDQVSLDASYGMRNAGEKNDASI